MPGKGNYILFHIDRESLVSPIHTMNLYTGTLLRGAQKSVCMETCLAPCCIKRTQHPISTVANSGIRLSHFSTYGRLPSIRLSSPIHTLDHWYISWRPLKM